MLAALERRVMLAPVSGGAVQFSGGIRDQISYWIGSIRGNDEVVDHLLAHGGSVGWKG